MLLLSPLETDLYKLGNGILKSCASHSVAFPTRPGTCGFKQAGQPMVWSHAQGYGTHFHQPFPQRPVPTWAQMPWYCSGNRGASLGQTNFYVGIALSFLVGFSSDLSVHGVSSNAWPLITDGARRSSVPAGKEFCSLLEWLQLPAQCSAGSGPPQAIILAFSMPPEMYLYFFWAPRCDQGMSLYHCA